MQLAPGANELRVELHPGAEISGSVRSYDGAPLGLATVEAVTVFSFDTEFRRANTVSDEGGAFRITGLEPGRYILTARAPGYADGGPDEPVEIDSSPVDGLEIVLEPGASIVGAVTGLGPSELAQVRIGVWRNSRSRTATPDAETGQPLDFAQLAAADAATIAALATGADNQRLVANATAAFSMNEGKFELKLRENADRLLVTRQGYESAQIPLSIAPGEQREGLVIRLQPSAPASPNQ